MGRKTFESLSKPLVNRRNVVLSSKPIYGVETYPSIPEALDALASSERVFVIGGGTVYAQLLERADEMYLTLVDLEATGDTFFPTYEHLLEKRFRLAHREDHREFAFVDYVKI
jgi:dihydrofolate reductase